MRAAAVLLLAGLAPAAALAQSTAPASGGVPTWPLAERDLTRPVEPGRVAPWQGGSAAAADVQETGSLHQRPAPGSTLQDWYGRQGRPVVALLFDRRLEHLPAGWTGTARLAIAGEKQAGGKTESANVTIAVERNVARPSVRQRPAVVQLVENALLQALQQAQVRLADPTLAERAQSARGKGGDTEYDGLKAAAGYVLEIELAATGAQVSMIGGLKSLSGALVTTVRTPVEDDLDSPAAADALARHFVRRLLGAPAQP